jgi:hypothetical protein
VKQIRKRLTYANVMSSIAVFLVLGGATALAAGLAKNSVGTKQLKSNAVTTAKIKKNAITTAKVKNGAITGAKVNLGSLGTVPNATHASTADTATNFSRYSTSGLKKASVGQNVPLASIGPFTFTGVCVDLGSNNFEAYVKVNTSQNGSFFTSNEVSYENANFNQGVDGIVNQFEQTEPDWFGGFSYYNEYGVTSADGSLILQGHANVGVHVFGADCAFQVDWLNLS